MSRSFKPPQPISSVGVGFAVNSYFQAPSSSEIDFSADDGTNLDIKNEVHGAKKKIQPLKIVEKSELAKSLKEEDMEKFEILKALNNPDYEPRTAEEIQAENLARKFHVDVRYSSKIQTREQYEAKQKSKKSNSEMPKDWDPEKDGPFKNSEHSDNKDFGRTSGKVDEKILEYDSEGRQILRHIMKAKNKPTIKKDRDDEKWAALKNAKFSNWKSKDELAEMKEQSTKAEYLDKMEQERNRLKYGVEKGSYEVGRHTKTLRIDFDPNRGGKNSKSRYEKRNAGRSGHSNDCWKDKEVFNERAEFYRNRDRERYGNDRSRDRDHRESYREPRSDRYDREDRYRDRSPARRYERRGESSRFY